MQNESPQAGHVIVDFLRETFPWWAIAVGLLGSGAIIAISEAIQNWRWKRILRKYSRD